MVAMSTVGVQSCMKGGDYVFLIFPGYFFEGGKSCEIGVLLHIEFIFDIILYPFGQQMRQLHIYPL